MGRSHDQRHPVGVRARDTRRRRGVLSGARARGAGAQSHHRRSVGSAAARSRHRAGLLVRQEIPAAAPGCAARVGRYPGGARRLRARDQVLAHPAARTRGADRWRARDPGHHRGVGAARLSHAAPLADQFVGFDDLLRALLAVRHNRLRQAVGLELVGMMAVQLPAVGLDHRLIARARCGLEHAIGLLERAVARRSAGAARLTRAKAAALDAQHRLDVRQLEGRDAQRRGDPSHEGPHRALQVVAGERRAYLDLEEHAQQVGPAAAGAPETGEFRAGVECGELAGGEAGDRLAHLRDIEAQVTHDGARGGDFQLRHAAVGLGEIAHDAEGGAEEALANRNDILARGQPRLQLIAVLIELMPEQHSEHGPDRTERGRTQQAAGEFADPFHAHGLASGPKGVAGSKGRYSTKRMPAPVVYRTELTGLTRIHEGKVRDIYAVDDDTMLIVTTDRLSALDVVLPDPIPDKGRVLNGISNFWFERTRHLVRNHLTGREPAEVVRDEGERALLAGRAVIVRRLKALPIEAVVRGYLIGSGWKDYQASGRVSGIAVPAGLQLAGRLPQPLFTPATKAQPGAHDENISFEAVVALIGPELAAAVRAAALALYGFAAEHARSRGIIIADTKFEFGLDSQGRLTLIDEVLTPDSSRFWPADSYRAGVSPPSFDKQFVRDYLETLDWNKQAPGPKLPPEIIARTSDKYREALARLTA